MKKIRLTCPVCNKPFERVISRLERSTLCPNCLCRVPFRIVNKVPKDAKFGAFFTEFIKGFDNKENGK